MVTRVAGRGGNGMSLMGRVALVTGAARGIGKSISSALHAVGASVVVSDIDFNGARAVADDLDGSHKTAMPLALDVTQHSAFVNALKQVTDAWGGVDIVVNNAGRGKRTPTPRITAEEFDQIVAINMRSVFFSCQVFAEHLRQRGYGRIVNITSQAGQFNGTVASAHYVAAKAGAVMLTKFFAKDLAGSGVTVNSVAPGPIASAKERLTPDMIAMVEKLVPVGRFGEPSEIAAAVAYLVSDQAGFVTGASLDVNGGLTMR